MATTSIQEKSLSTEPGGPGAWRHGHPPPSNRVNSVTRLLQVSSPHQQSGNTDTHLAGLL